MVLTIMELSQKDQLAILRSHFLERDDLVNHQISPYNNFMNIEIPQILEMEEEWSSVYKGDTYSYRFGDSFIDKPVVVEEDREARVLYPNEAILREIGYDANLYVDIHEVITDKNGEQLSARVYEKRLLSELPVMVGSDFCNTTSMSNKEKVMHGECPLTPGGYFVTRGGTQRIITGQERANYNQPYAFSAKKPGEYQIDVRSTKEMGIKPMLFRINYYKNKPMTVNTTFFEDEFPLSIFLRALDCRIDTPFMDTTITQNQAIGLMGVKDANKALMTDFLPHIESQDNKAIYVVMMIEKLLKTVTGERVEDDRDDFGNKRVDWAGFLLRYLFRLFLKKWITKFQSQMETRGNAKAIIQDNDTISKGIGLCMRTGNWGVQNTRTGVSQVAQTMNLICFVGHLRRFTTPGVREGKMLKIRFLHPSQWGYACVSETPEGAPTGVVKNLALLSSVSVYTSNTVPLNILKTITEVVQIDGFDEKNLELPKIFVNGDWVAVMSSDEECKELAKKLSTFKVEHILHRETAIVWDSVDRELRINTDSGRPLRPVFVLEGGIPVIEKKHLSMSWDELVYRGFITYIDPSESAFSTVASSLDEVYSALSEKRFHFNYSEIHPSIIFGAASGIIPLPDHSQAPRNTFGSSMLKQGQAMVGFNTRVKFETTSYELCYPQKQMCPTTTAEIIGHEENPTGINAIVAIGEGDGFNQEDSVVVNRSAIDRGFLRSMIYHSYAVSEKRSGTKQSEIIKIPHKAIMNPLKNYNKLDYDGIISEGMPVEAGDVLVGKVITNGSDVIDSSHVVKTGEGGIVDKVLITVGPDKLKLVKIRIRDYHIPESGDKFACPVGQKSTIGMLASQEDMPFTVKDGICPDIILHPPAIPSRMTINYLLQAICGKASLVSGDASDKFRDATPFREDMNGKFITEEVGKALRENGYDEVGTEEMICGKTGRPFKAKIFMGTVYYQALKHMVSKKIHSRSSGKVQVLTGQPISGRSKNGGLRIGEMERDCFISHGCASVIRERLVEVSDRYESDVCLGCGVFCIGQCKACKKQTKKVIVPYAMKLLFQELMAFGIFPKIEVE
jgi:DNA-directed RNA polymerase II subunit RPB2